MVLAAEVTTALMEAILFLEALPQQAEGLERLMERRRMGTLVVLVVVVGLATPAPTVLVERVLPGRDMTAARVVAEPVQMLLVGEVVHQRQRRLVLRRMVLLVGLEQQVLLLAQALPVLAAAEAAGTALVAQVALVGVVTEV